MVFQEWNLWANKTILENIAEGPRFILKMKKMQATRLADNLCNEVNLGNKINDYPHQLSGGEKQRAAIARALAMSPQILMLDEITSALDPSLVVEVLEVMLSLKKRQKSLILVTHHIDFAKAIADKVAFLWNGTIHEFGEAEEVLNNPRTFELQNFLKVLARTY
jgi:ABC-type polar amino acid transport system ATPase subunit